MTKKLKIIKKSQLKENYEMSLINNAQKNDRLIKKYK